MKFSQLAMAAVVIASVDAVHLGAQNQAMTQHQELAQAHAGSHAQSQGMQLHSTALSQADENFGWDDLTGIFNKAKKWVNKTFNKKKSKKKAAAE